MLTLDLLFLAALLIGLLGLGGGVALIFSKENRKMGLTVLIFGVIFFLCPLILYIAVIQPGPAAK